MPELEYAFKHALTQEATYQGILEQKRMEFHYQVGEGIEALYRERLEEYYSELAYHYSRSKDNKKAVDYLIKAGDRCKQLYANQDAIRYFNEALSLLDELGETSEYEMLRLKALEDLGDVHHTIGKHNDSIAYFEKAVALGTKRGLSPTRLAELYFKIGYACFWVEQFDKMIETAQAGLAVLGEDILCPQRVLLFENLRQGYEKKVEIAKMDEYASKNAVIVRDLGYFDGINKVYLGIAYTNGFYKGDSEYCIMWTKKCMEICERHNDKKGIAECYHFLGDVLNFLMNSREASHWYKKSITIAEDIGYADSMMYSYVDLGDMLFRRREELKEAEEYLKIGAGIASEVGHSEYVARAHGILGEIYLVRQEWDKAIDSKMLMADTIDLGKARDIRAMIHPLLRLSTTTGLARFLGPLEEACEKAGRTGELISLRGKLMKWIAENTQSFRLTQWYLVPKELSGQFTQTAFLDEFDGSTLRSEWQWLNSRGDCNYELNNEPSWLEIQAASGCKLFDNNFDAPRFLQEISGEFAIETKIASSGDMPAVGGLLVWKDEDNYIRFEKGMYGENEIGLSANVEGKWEYFGRGMLVSDAVYLRMERMGDIFSAYCSSDGKNWMTCGEVSFPAEAPVQAGIHAIGAIDRLYGNMATATRFDYFRVIRKSE